MGHGDQTVRRGCYRRRAVASKLSSGSPVWMGREAAQFRDAVTRLRECQLQVVECFRMGRAIPLPVWRRLIPAKGE